MTRNVDSAVTTFARYFILIAFALVMILPMWYLLVTSFKPHAYVLSTPPDLFPTHITFSNYAKAWESNNFSNFFRNSIVVSVIATVVGTLVSSAAAFVISRSQFVGRKLFYSLLLGSMMIPSMTFIVPQFKMMKQFGLLNSLVGLILIYSAGMIPFTTFLMKGFFDEVPKELEDSVLIDGGGKFTLFSRIMMPMALPSLATAFIFNFMGTWDEFTLAITFIDDPSKWTLPIAIMLFQGQHATEWGIVFAASVTAILPVILVFLVFQRFIIKGIMSGAVKG